MAGQNLRIAATADLHYAKHSRGTLHEAFAEISRDADVLLLCGDLTDYGLAEEAEELVADIRAAVRIPIIGVLGNHDFESGQSELVCKVLDDAGVNMLNGEAIEIAGVGFAGVCGFGGGFGRRMLNAWGEPLIKNPSVMLCVSSKRWQSCKPNAGLLCFTILQFARHCTERTRKFMRF